MILEQKVMTVGNRRVSGDALRNVMNGARLRWSHEIVLSVQETNLAPRWKPHPML